MHGKKKLKQHETLLWWRGIITMICNKILEMPSTWRQKRDTTKKVKSGLASHSAHPREENKTEKVGQSWW